MLITPRDYQSSAVSESRSIIQAGGTPVVTLQGGLGKSLIAALIAKSAADKGNRTLIYCPLKVLPGQFWKALMQAGLRPDQCAILSGSESDDEAQINRALVVIAMSQTVISKSRGDRFVEENRGTFAVAIFDECHLSFFHEARSRVTGKVEIGLTATPWCLHGGFDLERYNLVQPVTGVEAIAMGASTRLKILSYSDKAADVLPSRKGDFTTNQAEEVIGSIPREYVLETWLKEHPNASHTIAFMPSIESAREWAEWFTGRGYKAIAVTSDDKGGKGGQKARQDIYARFRAGEIKIMLTVTALATGFDEPSASCCLFLRKTKSVALWCQSLWRVTRKFEGKDVAIALDFVGNAQHHPHPEDILDWRNLPAPRGRECDSCSALNPKTSHKCLHCGHEFPKEERDLSEFASLDGIQLEELTMPTVSGSMVELKAIASLPPLEAMRELRRRVVRQGQSPSAAHYKFREIFGENPPRFKSGDLVGAIYGENSEMPHFEMFYFLLLSKSISSRSGRSQEENQRWIWAELSNEFGAKASELFKKMTDDAA